MCIISLCGTGVCTRYDRDSAQDICRAAAMKSGLQHVHGRVEAVQARRTGRADSSMALSTWVSGGRV